MKVVFKAFLEQVYSAPRALDNNKGFVQTVIAFLPGYTDSFGQKLGKDNYYMIDIYDQKENSPKFVPLQLVNSIIEFDCGVVGTRWLNKESQFGYTNRLQMITWKVVGKKSSAPAPVQAELNLHHTTVSVDNSTAASVMNEMPAEGTDDLPF